MLKAKNCYSYSKAALLYGASLWHGTKTDFMYEKSNVKKDIIRYYFVAYHPIDKATSGTEGQDQSRETDECIYNLHTHMCDAAMCPCRKNTSWHLEPISILRILSHV